jgi:hypothetical protein
MYTVNFFSDSIEVPTTSSTFLEDCSIEVECTVPIEIDTIPHNLTTMGPKVKDGAGYLYPERQGCGTFLETFLRTQIAHRR